MNLTSLGIKKKKRYINLGQGKEEGVLLEFLSPTPIFSFFKERMQPLKYQRNQDSKEVGRDQGLFLDKGYLNFFIFFIISGAVRKDPKITTGIEGRHNIDAPDLISSIHFLYCVHVRVCVCFLSISPPLNVVS